LVLVALAAKSKSASLVIVERPASLVTVAVLVVRNAAANVMASAVTSASAASDVPAVQKAVIALNATVVQTKSAAKPAPVQSALNNFRIALTRPIVFC
jgi:hypothetical protein